MFESQDIEKMLACLHRFDARKGDFIFVEGGVPHAIGKNCFLAELQEPTDLMVIPEKVTPSGIVLTQEKLHCGLGFEKMFDCFEYNGYDRETTRNRYFKKPNRKNANELILADESITDKFRLTQIDVDGQYTYNTCSYCVGVVIEGNANINEAEIIYGDRVFISESETDIKISGNAQILFCSPA